MFRVDMTDQEQVARQCGFGQQQGILFGKEQVIQMEDVDARKHHRLECLHVPFDFCRQ
ncbi:hypothetical protein D3C78_1673470 [compost metagenome]